MQESTDLGQIRSAGLAPRKSGFARLMRSFGWSLCRPYFIWLVDRLQEKEGSIEQLKRQIETQDTAIDQLKRQIEAQGAAVDQLKPKIGTQEAVVEELKRRVVDLQMKATDKIAIADFLHSVEEHLTRLEQASSAASGGLSATEQHRSHD